MYIKSENNGVKLVDDVKGQQLLKNGWSSDVSEVEKLLFNAKKGIKDNVTKILIPFWYESTFKPNTGYGNVVYSLFQQGLKDKVLFHYEIENPDYILVALSPYGFSLLPKIKNKYPDKKIFLHTMWETDKLPKFVIDDINKYVDVLILPSQDNAKIYKKCGVKAPIEVMPYGVDDCFVYKPKTKSDTVKFLHYNSGNERKGYRELIEAFCKEFTIKDKVSLTLKCQSLGCFTKTFKAIEDYKTDKTPQINVINQQMDREQLVELLHSHHCFVFPSKGEGFGLTPLEAIATGTPCIVPNKHGIAEYFDKKICLEVETEKQETDYLLKIYESENTNAGFWDVPKVNSIRKQMRHFYKNYDKLVNVDPKTPENILKTFNWSNSVKTILNIIKKYD